jgi:hypothetical protein
MKVAKAHAQRHRLTLGQAVSDLVIKAAERPLLTEERNGLRVLRLNRRSPKVTTARVNELLTNRTPDFAFDRSARSNVTSVSCPMVANAARYESAQSSTR